jgi:nonsense-mediated mRNA decay protein 3
MALCLKRVSGLSKVKILDAFWIWTEPHSKRLKVAIEIEKMVLDDRVTLRQKLEVEYVIHNRQCLECIREASEHSWGSQVQLRQRTSDSRALIALESSLTKAGMHHLMLSVDVVKHGMNLFFKNKNQAEKVINFLSTLVPVRVKSSKKLVSANKQSNTQRYEHVYLVDIVPLVKHDLVYLSRDHKGGGGGAALSASTSGLSSGGGGGGAPQGELMIVERLSSSLHLLNPLTLRRVEMTATRYFSLSSPLIALMSARQAIPYIVLDIDQPAASGGGRGGGKEESISEITVCLPPLSPLCLLSWPVRRSPKNQTSGRTTSPTGAPATSATS